MNERREAPLPARIADVLALLLLALALVVALRGRLVISAGPVRVPISRPARVAAEAFAILLARQALWPGGRPRFVLALAGLLVAMSGESLPRRIGDGLEYAAMALNLGAGSPPSLTPEELVAAATRFGEPGDLLRIPLLQGPDGRQDFPHFWFYSLAAAPFARTADVLGVSPVLGFTVLNLLLLIGAAWAMLARLPPAAALLLLGSPILWWVDKAHTEVFTFSLLSIAAVLLVATPAWALAVLAAAATQNPPLTALVVLALVHVAWIRRDRDRALLFTVPMTLALCVIHPLYYWSRIGRWSPLAQATTPHWPSPAEFTAVLWDPNLGLLVHFPALAAVLTVAGFRLARSHWRRPETWLVLASALVLLVGFAQTSNFNHGGTRGISRYGMWLIPFAIPALLAAPGLLRPGGFVLLALGSFVASAIAFHPRLPESHLAPSALARWLWTKAPGLDNPLPEVFVERSAGKEWWTLPAATPGCEKALLAGTGSTPGVWPLPCPPAMPPPACAEAKALCYANRDGGGYSFVRAPGQASFFFFPLERWVWRARPGEATLRLLARIPWAGLRDADEGQPGTFVVAKERAGTIGVRQSGGALLAWLDKPRPGARLVVRVPRRMSGVVIAPATGDEYGTLDVPADTDTVVSFPWVWPMALLLAAEGG